MGNEWHGICETVKLFVMDKENEQQIAARLARIMALMCVRNSNLEDIHAGRVPTTQTGDYSDVFVIDADGQRIPWTEVSRIDDNEMRALLRDVVNRLYTFHLNSDNLGLRAEIERWLAVAGKWDEPELEPQMISRGNVASQ